MHALSNYTTKRVQLAALTLLLALGSTRSGARKSPPGLGPATSNPFDSDTLTSPIGQFGGIFPTR